jgi:hypothetical protein
VHSPIFYPDNPWQWTGRTRKLLKLLLAAIQTETKDPNEAGKGKGVVVEATQNVMDRVQTLLDLVPALLVIETLFLQVARQPQLESQLPPIPQAVHL